jgi:dimethylamine/trimethylamine dehydrogenase
LALARRGYEVAIAEAGAEPGGRLRFEAALPGLSEWRRVLDWRLGRLRQLPNASLYLRSRLSADEVLGFGFERVVVATGSRWTTELYSAAEVPAPPLAQPERVLTPDDLAAGAAVAGPAVVFDFDHYHVGGGVAELLAARGVETAYVTPAGHASAWTIMSNELPRVHQALARAGVPVRTLRLVHAFDGALLTLADLFTGETSVVPCATLVVVGMRRPRDELFRALAGDPDRLAAMGIRSVHAVGDALVPGALAHAIYHGHRYARELDMESPDSPYRLDGPVTVSGA